MAIKIRVLINVRCVINVGLFNFIKKKKSDKSLVETTSKVKKTSQDLLINRIIHPEIRNLIWIKNKKNDIDEVYKKRSKSIELDRVNIQMNILGSEEPSMIDLNLSVKESKSVNRPSYYPAYSGLTPEQRNVYWNYLKNPYDSNFDIGYVFLFYYGLERHLFNGEIEKVVDVILKLRNQFKNNSFQYYSGNAIVLSCLIDQRADILLKFLDSLDVDYKKKIAPEILLFAIHSFNLKFKAIDLMFFSKEIGFKKDNYIKEYPKMFADKLKEIMVNKNGEDYIYLQYLVRNLDEVKQISIRPYANLSLIDKEITLPNLLSSETLLKEGYNLLYEAHEKVKQELVTMRKEGLVPTKLETLKKVKKELEFDYQEEARLLEELEITKNNAVDRHFTYNALIDFYYKYREVNQAYLKKCIEYCEIDINHLDELNEKYVKEEIKSLNTLKNNYDKKDYSMEIKRIYEQKFPGNIPAFKRLAVIYEKKKDYNRALEIVKDAITYYKEIKIPTDDFEKRLNRLNKKAN